LNSLLIYSRCEFLATTLLDAKKSVGVQQN